MISPTHFLYHWLCSKRQSPQNQGFTLLELLVVVIIGGLIVSGLLWVVVDLISNDNREAAISETEREVQMSMDYIVSDLREAVYIYDNLSTLSGYIPLALTENITASSGSTPVLAFWKTEAVDLTGMPEIVPPTSTTPGTSAEIICEDEFSNNADLESECKGLYQSRHAYTLVVYVQTVGSNNTWSGESRLRRHELRKYQDNKPTVANSMAWNVGYVDPAVVGFENWPLVSGTTTNCQTQAFSNDDCKTRNPGTPVGSTAVLMDFIAHPWLTKDDEPTLAIPTVDRDDLCPGDPNPSNPPNPPYSLVPRDSSGVAVSLSAYACVRSDGSSTSGDTTTYSNQDVIVYLRGNAKGRAGTSSDAILPVAETQVTMRGVIDQSP